MGPALVTIQDLDHITGQTGVLVCVKFDALALLQGPTARAHGRTVGTIARAYKRINRRRGRSISEHRRRGREIIRIVHICARPCAENNLQVIRNQTTASNKRVDQVVTLCEDQKFTMGITYGHINHASHIRRVEDIAADMPAKKTKGPASLLNFSKIAINLCSGYCAVSGPGIRYALIYAVVSKIIAETTTGRTVATISNRNKGNGRNGKTRFSVAG